MASDITITSLDATAGLGQIVLSAAGSAAGGRTGLPYAEAAKVEFWGATTNNLGSASKVGESDPAGIHIHGDLSDGTTWYYWARAKDPQGNFGPYSSGISATTKTAALGPDSVGSDEIQDGAVENRHINNLSASKINVGDLSGITITGNEIRTRSSGARVVLSDSLNAIALYSGGSNAVAKLGFDELATLTIEGSSRAATFESSNFSGTIVVENTSNGAAINATADGNGSSAHGVRAFNNDGGDGALAVSNDSGGWGVYAQSGGVGPFTGGHDALIRKTAETRPGDIVVDVVVVARSGIDDTLTEVALADQVAMRRVAGVVSRRVAFKKDSGLASLPRTEDCETGRARRSMGQKRGHMSRSFDRLTINALGEGQVNVCGRGGPIQAGDYICTSGLPGKGQRQNDAEGAADDLLRRCTVAQAREAVTFDEPDQVKRIAVFYRCG